MLETIRGRIALALLPKKPWGKADNTGVINPFQTLSMQNAGVPVYTDMTVKKATREGYKISVYVYRAVRTIIQASSAIPWVILDSKEERIEGHPLAKVLRKPNPEFSGQDLIEFLIAHLELTGNALWQPIIVGKQVKELWTVMPDLVQPIPSDVPGEWLKGWQVTSAGGDQCIAPPEQFVHFMMVDPGNPYWGMGPLQAAARTIDTDNEAQDTQKISMQNRGVTDGVFSHETAMTAEQFEEARRQVKEYFLAKGNRRAPWVLGGGAKWQQMSLTAIEMDYIASRLHNKRDIAGAFGISPIFLGDLEQSSYNNMAEARKALYEDVVIPLLDDIKSTLNLRLAPMYGDITISYDTSKVAALREDYTKKVEQARNLWGMGVPFSQINERLEMGFNEFTGWDLSYLPLTLLPAGAPVKSDYVKTDPWFKELEERAVDTEEAKAAQWKRIDRRRVAWWGVVSKKVIPLYEAEEKAIAKALKGKAPDRLVDAAAEAIDSLSPEWEKMLTAISAALIEDFGNEIATDLGAEKSDKPTEEKSATEVKWVFDPMSAAARLWITRHAAASVKTILATNLDDVRRVILAGHDEGLGTAAIGRNLRQFYTDRSASKAMRIARTETSHAAGFGQREAAKQSGVVKTHSWITSRDDRVRDSHAALEGETVPFDKPYSDGSMYPGEQDINCRCVESYGTR